MDPSLSPFLDLGNLDEEVRRILESAEADADAEQAVAEPLTIDPTVSRELLHSELARAFVEHQPDESDILSRKLAEQLAKEEKKQIKQRKLDEERSKKAAYLEQIDELFEGRFKKDMIKKLLNQHNYDVDAVIGILADASSVSGREDSFVPASHAPKTVYAPMMPIVFKDLDSPTRPGSVSPRAKDKESCYPSAEEEAIEIANDFARKLRNQAIHHYQRASCYGANDIRSGALTAIARDEIKDAKFYETTANKLEANKVTESLDLHGYPVERALHLLYVTLKSVRKRRPFQRKLEVVTGQGNNNLRKKAVLRSAVEQWLAQMEIKYERPLENPGAVVIHLPSVQ